MSKKVTQTKFASDFSQTVSISEIARQLLKTAIDHAASDIHLEPYKNILRIRMRIDGLLHEMRHLPADLAARVTSHLKVLAHLDLTEHRLPQDGRFTFRDNNDKSYDCRINICPVIFGEKIVIRILDLVTHQLSINKLGMTPEQQGLLLQKINQPQGMILITGPTGSGKTITLYSVLNHINKPEKNIVTIEDPIEIKLNNINQSVINPKIGLDFAALLRAFLRQDPDVIMVGEIRDSETAEIAVKAAHTGHLVFSSLHANNCVQAITRLNQMDINTQHLNNAISLIITQRLLRKLCIHCKQKNKAIGCDRCLDGYSGRIGIFEMLDPNNKNQAQFSLEDAADNVLKKNLTSHLETKRVLP